MSSVFFPDREKISAANSMGTVEAGEEEKLIRLSGQYVYLLRAGESGTEAHVAHHVDGVGIKRAVGESY